MYLLLNVIYNKPEYINGIYLIWSILLRKYVEKYVHKYNCYINFTVGNL